jgi:hypothetical protein
MSIGTTMLGRRHVLPSVVSTLSELMVEGTFPTGTYLVTVHHPIGSDDGDLEKALYGSFLPVPSNDIFPLPEASVYESANQPGAIVAVKGKAGTIKLNEGRKRIRLRVKSTGDRPIQVAIDEIGHMPETDAYRSGHITTSLKRTRSFSSTVYERMDTVWISPLAPLFVSSPAIPRRSRWCKLQETRSSRVEIKLRRASSEKCPKRSWRTSRPEGFCTSTNQQEMRYISISAPWNDKPTSACLDPQPVI